MTQMGQKCVIFVGTSASICDTLDAIAVQCGIAMRALDSVGDCREVFDRDNGVLLVMELDGNASRGLQLLAELTQQYPQVPVLAIVERGDIRTTVHAIRAGAADCLDKPVETGPLTAAVSELLNQIDTRSGDSVVALTPAETTVLQYILQGRTNRQIAEALYRSPRTIEVHRRHIMRKLGASTIVDLVKAAGLKGSA